MANKTCDECGTELVPGEGRFRRPFPTCDLCAAASNTKICKGDRIEILPEWQDAGDANYEWYATGDEDGGRVSITPRVDLPLPPVYRVQTNMVRKTAN